MKDENLRGKKINDYLKGFGNMFVCHKTDNISKCEQFISGLLHSCKSNIERISEHVFGSDYNQLQHFISVSPWDSFEVMSLVAEKVHTTLCETTSKTTSKTPMSPISLGLILDESGWEKSGKKSVGVARQYIGQVGKIANGQVGVFASLSDGDQVGLLQGRIYLPKEWTNDKKRCDKAGIPEHEQIYRTKPELAVEILKTLPVRVTYDWVGGDCIYGNSLVVRQYLYDKKQAFVLDVGEELGVYLTPPQLYIPAKKDGRGRTPTAFVCDSVPILLKDLIKQIPEQEWQTITHRQGTKGPLIRRATIIDVYIWKSERGAKIESIQLIISTETDGSEIKYSLCNNVTGKMSLQIALFRSRVLGTTILDRKSLSKCQRTIEFTSISSTFLESLASSYCIIINGSAFYFTDSKEKYRRNAITLST